MCFMILELVKIVGGIKSNQNDNKTLINTPKTKP